VAVTKQQLDAMVTGITFHSSKPPSPQFGDVYIDTNTYESYAWTGNDWAPFSTSEQNHSFTPPTEEQLEKHPALKAVWDEFMVLKRLLGV
jgi:hypothetical protein